MKDVHLDRVHRTPQGDRVRLRMARSPDRDGLVGLLDELGLRAEELDVRRALRCHPGTSWAVAATAWDGMAERLVGLGRLDRDGALTLLAADDGVRGLLREALEARARLHNRFVA